MFCFLNCNNIRFCFKFCFSSLKASNSYPSNKWRSKWAYPNRTHFVQQLILLLSGEVLGYNSCVHNEINDSKTGTLSKIFNEKFVRTPYWKWPNWFWINFFQKCLCESNWFLILFRENYLALLALRLDFFSTLKFLRTVFGPTSFTNVLSFLRPLTISPISGAVTSIKFAPVFFAAWTIYFFRGDFSSLKSLRMSTKTSSTMSCVTSKNRKISWILSSCFVWCLNQNWVFDILRKKRTTRVILMDTKRIFSPVVSPISTWN